MAEILKILSEHNTIVLSVISGIGASIITVILTSLINMQQTRNAFKVAHRSFISIVTETLNYNAEPLSKKEAVKVLPTKDYFNLMHRSRNQGIKSECQFVHLSNLTDFPIMEVHASFRVILFDDKSEEDGWRIDVNFPILNKHESILVPLHKEGARLSNRYLADAEITYRTLANEKMKITYRIKPTESNDSVDEDQLPELTVKYYCRKLGIYKKIIESKTSPMGFLTFLNTD